MPHDDDDDSLDDDDDSLDEDDDDRGSCDDDMDDYHERGEWRVEDGYDVDEEDIEVYTHW